METPDFLPTILTETITRQIPQSLKSATVKSTYTPKTPLEFVIGHSDGRLGNFSKHTETLVGKFGKMADP